MHRIEKTGKLKLEWTDLTKKILKKKKKTKRRFKHW